MYTDVSSFVFIKRLIKMHQKVDKLHNTVTLNCSGFSKMTRMLHHALAAINSTKVDALPHCLMTATFHVSASSLAVLPDANREADDDRASVQREKISAKEKCKKKKQKLERDQSLFKKKKRKRSTPSLLF